MIKFKFKDSGEVDLSVEGTLMDLLTGASAFILGMFRSIRSEGDDGSAELFLFGLKHLLTDDDSPLLKRIEEEHKKTSGEVQ